MVGKTTRHAGDDDKEHEKLHLRIGHLSAHLKDFKKEIFAKLANVELKTGNLPLEFAALTTCNCSDKMKLLEAKVDDIFCLDCADKIFKLETEIDSKVAEIFGKFGKMDCADKIFKLETKLDSKVADILNKLGKMDCADTIHQQEFEVIDDVLAVDRSVQENSSMMVSDVVMKKVLESEAAWIEYASERREIDETKWIKFMEIVTQERKEDEKKWIERTEFMAARIDTLCEVVSLRDACIANLRASTGQSSLVSVSPVSSKQREDSQVAFDKAKTKKKR